MPFVEEIPGTTQRAFRKNKVPNEKFRFVTATSGQRFIAEHGTSAAFVSAASPIGTITLPYDYFVGKKQLLVYLINPANTDRIQIANETDYLQAIADGDVATALPAVGFIYRETTKNTIEVENLAGGNIAGEIIETFMPHTSVPGANSDRVIINNQPDDIGLQLKGPGDGIELVSANGTVYILSAGNGGVLNMRQKI